jgi:CRP/FNR family transcriptional regulator, cyclic AMP receptor protein
VDTSDLAGQPLFEGMSERDLEAVARWADVVDVSEGYHLLHQGRLPHEFFVILEGKAGVEREGQPLAELGPGDFFGEIALLEDDRRTATVVATSPMRLMVLAPREFDAMCHQFPAVAERIDQAFRERRAR